MVFGPKYFHLITKLTSVTFVDFILYTWVDKNKGNLLLNILYAWERWIYTELREKPVAQLVHSLQQVRTQHPHCKGLRVLLEKQL